MNTYEITSKADTRSQTRRVRTWTIEAASQDEAIEQARENHLKVIGWNGSIWISKVEVAG